MNCRDWEERIALHAEGDLAEPEAGSTAQHLADCAECRQFEESLKRSLALLLTAHQEPLAPADLAAVRTRVLERIWTPRQPRRLAWIDACAAATAGMVVFLLIPRPIEPPPVRLVPPPEPQISLTAPPVTVPQPAKRPPRARPKPRIHEPPEPLMVKLVTDDPDIVIYWIAN